MTILEQVCTLEQAKRIDELGVKELGYFVWVPPFPIFNETTRLCSLTEFDGRLCTSILSAEARNLVVYYNAYNASELGEMLPCESGIITWDVSYNDHQGVWECRIYDLVKWKGGGSIPPVAYESECDTMAEAMADTLIHCLENKLVTPSPYRIK